jgi:hypothetical protein
LGYHSLSNAGGETGLFSLSGMENHGFTAFTDYYMPAAADPSYVLHTLVPQYYSYEGYVLSTTETPPHSSAARVTGNPVLDYSAQPEYWVTVYLRPIADPGSHTWDVRTNAFGTIQS